MAGSAEVVGELFGGVPYLKVGQGPPLVCVLGLTPRHEVPAGLERRMALAQARAFAPHFTVYVVNRKHGLTPGESMADIAGHLAAAIEHDLGGPVRLQGVSTGGSVALQLAVDRPELVRRLVVVSAAHRLGPYGREVQADMARLIRAGESREAWAEVITAMLPRPARRPAGPLARLMAGSMVPDDPTDVLVTLDAEDVFDVGDRLDRITAPTLVLGGGRDPFYPPDLFRETATGVPDGRVHLFPGWGHGRASASVATAQITLGFLLAGVRAGEPDG